MKSAKTLWKYQVVYNRRGRFPANGIAALVEPLRGISLPLKRERPIRRICTLREDTCTIADFCDTKEKFARFFCELMILEYLCTMSCLIYT